MSISNLCIAAIPGNEHVFFSKCRYRWMHTTLHLDFRLGMCVRKVDCGTAKSDVIGSRRQFDADVWWHAKLTPPCHTNNNKYTFHRVRDLVNPDLLIVSYNFQSNKNVISESVPTADGSVWWWLSATTTTTTAVGSTSASGGCIWRVQRVPSSKRKVAFC